MSKSATVFEQTGQEANREPLSVEVWLRWERPPPPLCVDLRFEQLDFCDDDGFDPDRAYPIGQLARAGGGVGSANGGGERTSLAWVSVGVSECSVGIGRNA